LFLEITPSISLNLHMGPGTFAEVLRQEVVKTIGAYCAKPGTARIRYQRREAG
jgi:hypothetical protein